MKKRSLRYAGDKAVRALLERYACPTSFHVIRTRLLGNIATPKLDASPLRAIESFWEGELPGFDNVGAASELFESLMGLWNELARHQSATKPTSRRGTGSAIGDPEQTSPADHPFRPTGAPERCFRYQMLVR